MENKERLQEYHYDDYKVVTNFETYEDAVQYAAETGGEMVEIGFVDGSDNPLADDTAQLMKIKKPFRVGLDPEYTVYYSEDEGFQEMAQNILEEMKELEDDIALRKEQDGTYTALLMRCTHADNPLVSTGNGFICNLHGSTFDKEGSVTKGPAALPLRKYSVEIVSDNILIHIN